MADRVVPAEPRPVGGSGPAVGLRSQPVHPSEGWGPDGGHHLWISVTIAPSERPEFVIWTPAFAGVHWGREGENGLKPVEDIFLFDFANVIQASRGGSPAAFGAPWFEPGVDFWATVQRGRLTRVSSVSFVRFVMVRFVRTIGRNADQRKRRPVRTGRLALHVGRRARGLRRQTPRLRRPSHPRRHRAGAWRARDRDRRRGSSRLARRPGWPAPARAIAAVPRAAP